MSLVVSVIWDDLVSDLSHDSQIPIWPDALPVNKMDKNNIETHSCCAKFNYFQLTFIPIVLQ